MCTHTHTRTHMCVHTHTHVDFYFRIQRYRWPRLGTWAILHSSRTHRHSLRACTTFRSCLNQSTYFCTTLNKSDLKFYLFIANEMLVTVIMVWVRVEQWMKCVSANMHIDDVCMCTYCVRMCTRTHTRTHCVHTHTCDFSWVNLYEKRGSIQLCLS